MYLKTNPSQTGYSGTSQVAGGRFLIGFQDFDDTYEIEQPAGHKRKLNHIYCCIRSVRLRQLGHWMMGNIDIAGHSFSISGEFGHDGFPHHFDEMVQINKPSEKYPKGEWKSQALPAVEIERMKKHFLHLMPEEISTAYWTDDTGHNSMGVSRKVVAEWANENFELLAMGERHEYEVICGNIGHVHHGYKKGEAMKVYREYVRQSKSGVGRAGNESVYFWCDNEPTIEYHPKGETE